MPQKLVLYKLFGAGSMKPIVLAACGPQAGAYCIVKSIAGSAVANQAYGTPMQFATIISTLFS